MCSSALFGGGQQSKPAPPIIPPPVPVPDTRPSEVEGQATRDDEARKLRQRRGASGTALADEDMSLGIGKTLLGKGL